jgi:hypothetical protein
MFACEKLHMFIVRLATKDPRERELSWQVGERTSVEILTSREKEFNYLNHFNSNIL